MVIECAQIHKDVTRRLSGFWELLTENEQKQMREGMKITAYQKNELIYREGENPDRLLCVITGKVKIYRDGVGGRHQIIRVLRPVQYFGYRASMAHEPYVTAAAAFEASSICSFPMSVVSRIIETNSKVAQFFIAELATDLGISDRRTVSLTQKHVRGRLAESLLYLKDVYGVNAYDGSLCIKLTREDLACLSNMTTSNAIRTLAAFAGEGLVAIKGKSILITDEEGLSRISNIG